MKHLNRSVLFTSAWKFVRMGKSADMSDALCKAWYNAKAVDSLMTASQSSLSSWSGWKDQGREVIHGSKCVAQLKLYDPYTKNGTRIVSFFTAEQTCPLGSQD